MTTWASGLVKTSAGFNLPLIFLRANRRLARASCTQRYLTSRCLTLPAPLLDAIACLDGPALVPPEGTLDRLLTRSDLAAGKPDLEVIVTNPVLLGRGDGASAAPRLWIVVAAEAAAGPAGVSGTLGRGRLERRVVVPVGESASTGLLNLLAEVGHDPDAIGG